MTIHVCYFREFSFMAFLMFLFALVIFALNLWDFLSFGFCEVMVSLFLHYVPVCYFVFCLCFVWHFLQYFLHFYHLEFLSLNAVRSGGSLSYVQPKSLNKSGFMHSFPFLPNFLKLGSNSSTFSAMVIFLPSVMWNVDSSPLLFFTSTEFPLMPTSLKFSLNQGWNAFDVWSCTSTRSPMFISGFETGPWFLIILSLGNLMLYVTKQ